MIFLRTFIRAHTVLSFISAFAAEIYTHKVIIYWQNPAAISEQVGASDRVTVVTDPAACARLSDSRGVSKMRVIGKNRESVFTSVLAISAHYFVSCSMEQAW